MINKANTYNLAKRFSPMQNTVEKAAKQKPSQSRSFKIGIVAASDIQFDVISRIFTVTRYRTRQYHPVRIDAKHLLARSEVDFLLLCSSNPNVINAWEKSWKESENSDLPLVYLSHPSVKLQRDYVLTSPVNPSKLVKLLDRFTIKQLNYFPEFEIGHDTNEIEDVTLNGLKLLRTQTQQDGKCATQRKRALVVDDSLAVRKQMQIEFELLNDDLDVVPDAESALEAVRQRKYDIVFLDVVMPGMDGYTACKQIKKTALNRSTPIVMLTSRSSSFDKFKGTLAGCAAYLIKPINHNEFEDVYKQHTNKPS
ncbi:response regulator [Saccharophagus degradans]|uniref:response regulator n=2 Tax=Saccharophagus degradans TaxID=86304 RepID=UPI002477F673|nr:response regulator [Saccharophagus degradans]WGO98048.1 response regulator [Saccharophagus degradans]